MEEHESVVKPKARAASTAMATTRSLKECVGLPESSLTYRPPVTPSSRARRSAFTSLVKPGFMLGLSATSAGTGSSGA